ncbi:hypothetical protein [Streptomyces malaysiensis]|nr:hypothetical protein R8789_18940 [Streptomyces malaysiensis]
MKQFYAHWMRFTQWVTVQWTRLEQWVRDHRDVISVGLSIVLVVLALAK